MVIIAKSKGKTFTLELKLNVENWQSHILRKRFEVARKMYNSTLSYALKQCKLMKESKKYRQQLRSHRELKQTLKTTKDKKLFKQIEKELKVSTKELNRIRMSFGLSEYGLHGYIKKHQHNYKQQIDSFTAQKIASSVWKAIESVIFKGSKAHFKKYGTITSLEGKSNASGIRFSDHSIKWNGLEMLVVVRKNDLFVQESLAYHQVKYSRLVKKNIRGKENYYVQLVMDGIPPAKRIHHTGAFRYKETPNKRVGIDIGTSTVAVSSEKEVSIQPLAPKVPAFEKEKRRLLRKLDRSRRNTNPNHFNADGTVKRGLTLTWVRSNNYIRTRYQLKELYRNRRVYVKEQHSKIANRILACGNEVYVETMNFIGLAERTKETNINLNGKHQRKKRFGQSIASYAPAMLLAIIHQKLQYIEQKINKVNTQTFKASQYNHVTDTYKKKKLHQRWSMVGNHLVQRDLYSAFLLMNSHHNLKHPNRELCVQTFKSFIELHDKQIDTLKQNHHKLPSSIGIQQIS